MEKALEERTTLIMNNLEAPDDENQHVIQNDDRGYTIKAQVIAPIITQGDPIGAEMCIRDSYYIG